MTNGDRIEWLYRTGNLPDEELRALLISLDQSDFEHLCKRACEVREQVYGKDVYLRGLIEFSNYCRNDCYYCGIRRSNRLADRYRLSEDEIVACSDAGYELGFRTFVLQSGEDLSYTTADICHIVSRIRSRHPDCAVTLSIGEKSRSEYQADRKSTRLNSSHP